MPQYDSIAFLSDMGTHDESVGVCKAVMLQQAPHVTILDITHEVPVFDVRAGALALTRAIQFLPSGVIVAAVDPGSPREQRYIAVDMGEGVLIGPDNGILAPATQLIGMPKRVHEITNPDFRIEAPGAVFAARDILAPAAGVIAGGIDLAELGAAVPLEQLVPGMLQLARHDEGGAFLGEVWSQDRFGNVQINITPEEIASRGAKIGDTVIVRVGETDHIAKYVERYADLAVSQLGILVDSTGMISVVKNLDSASRELDVKEGKAITILPPNTSVTGRDITIESVSEAAPLQTPEQAAAQPHGTPEITLPLTPPAEMAQPAQVPYVEPAPVAPQAPVAPAPVQPAQPPQAAYEAPAPVGGSFPAQHQDFPAAPIAPTPQAAAPQAPVESGLPEVETPSPSDVFGHLITPAPAPSQPLPNDTALVEPPVAPQAPSAPAAYFPEPAAAPVSPQTPVAPAPSQVAAPAAAPENVFDLFKGDVEEEQQSDPQNQN